MEKGVGKDEDQLSSQATTGMGDLSLLGVITMTSDMSADASSSLNMHRFSAPLTFSKHLNSPPLYSVSAHHVSNTSPSSNPADPNVSSTQLTVNPYSSGPAHIQTISGSQFIPHQTASNPRNSSNSSSNPNSTHLQNVLQSHQNPTFHSSGSAVESSRTVFHRLHNTASSQTLNQSFTLCQQFSSSPGQDFSYKLSKTPMYSTAHMSCNSPMLVSSASQSTTPLATQDLNKGHSRVIDGHSLTNASCSVSAAGQDSSSAHHVFAQTTDTHKASLSSIPSPSHSSQSQPSPRTGCHMRTHSTSSTVNECPSPQVSDLGSEDTNISMSQSSFTQNYCTLTPWTSKLTAPGYTPLPHPTSETMPIPLENINKEYMLAISPSLLEIPVQSRHPRLNQVYSRLQPGMAAGYNNYPYGKTVKNGTMVGGSHDYPYGKTVKNGTMVGGFHAQKAHFKILPNKEHRFKRTVDALQKSGLWEVAMKTGNLIKHNQELQKELEQFRADALTFLKSVIKNPQNRDFIKNVLNNALASNAAPRNGSSVMTVVVSAAAAAAAASVRLDSNGSTDDSGSTST